MKKEFTDHSAALRLDLLGFNEPCFGYYLCKRSDLPVELEITTWVDLLPYDSSSCKAPTYQQAFRFFREKYDLFGCIDLQVCNPSHWFIRIDKIDINDYLYHSEDENIQYNTYEEAESACLDKLIEITKDLAAAK
jgi:hypothetical protein